MGKLHNEDIYNVYCVFSIVRLKDAMGGICSTDFIVRNDYRNMFGGAKRKR